MAYAKIAQSAASQAGKSKATPWIVGGVIVAVTAISYFGFARPIMNLFGITESSEDRTAARLKGLSAINSNYWRNRSHKVTLTPVKAKEIAKLVYNSTSWYNDDEEQLYGAIRSAGSDVNLSYVAYVFQEQYKSDMLSYIENFLNSSELSNVKTIISNY